MTEASERAVRAQQLLDDDVLQQAFDLLERYARESVIRVDLDEPNEVLAAAAYMRAAYAIRPHLESIITTGKLEAKPKLYRA